MVTIEYGRWAWCQSLEQERMLAVPVAYVLELEQRRAERAAKREGWELLPGPPERRVRQLNFGSQELAYYIWPLCKVTEEER
jgi:hypothetical protein